MAMKPSGAFTRAPRKGELASNEELRQLDRRPVSTGRLRVLGHRFASPFTALPLTGQLASQPEQQRTSTVGSPTTSPRELQMAAASAGNPRQAVGRV
jgi:hypothetical protein